MEGHNPGKSNAAWEVHDYKGHEIHVNVHSDRGHVAHIKEPGHKHLSRFTVGGRSHPTKQDAVDHAKYTIDHSDYTFVHKSEEDDELMMSTDSKGVPVPKATSKDYPEMKPEEKETKKVDFKKTIERVQKALGKIQSMDQMKKAKLTAELGEKLGPILGQGMADPVTEIPAYKDFPAVEVEELHPSMKMVKAWDSSIDIVKADLETWMPMHKAMVDNGLSPQRKASQRAERNTRHYSLNDKAAPKSSLPRHDKFYNKEGALAGKKGEKISGKPKNTSGAGIGENHSEAYSRSDLRGRNTAGINTEWAGKHTHPGHAAHARQKAVELHSKKLTEIKASPKPNLPQSKSMDKAEPTPWKGPNSSSKGVNAPLPTRETAGIHGNSQSDAGVALRNGHKQAAKQYHKQTLSEVQSMPKPKLPK